MNLNLIHDYIYEVERYTYRQPGDNVGEMAIAMNSTWRKLSSEEQEEASRLCELKEL